MRDLTRKIQKSKRQSMTLRISLRRGDWCMVNGAGLAMATMDIIKLTAQSRQISSMLVVARPLKG